MCFALVYFIKGIKLIFYRVYRHYNLFGMLGEHSKSLLITRLCLCTVLIFSQHSAWFITPLNRRKVLSIVQTLYSYRSCSSLFFRDPSISKEAAIFRRKLESNHAQRKEVLCLLIVLRFDNHLKLFLRLVILLMLML